MKLRIPTRPRPPDEEEHAERQVLAARRRAEVEARRRVPQDPEEELRVAPVQRPAVPLVRDRQVPVGPVVRLQVREVYLLRPLTPVPLSFLQCGLKSTKARSVKSKRSLTGRGNSSSAPRASSQRRIMIGKVFFRPHSAARANT